MKFATRILVAVAVCLNWTAIAPAQDYEVEVASEAPPTDELSGEIGETLSGEVIRVLRKGRPYCDIWLRKDVPVAADFTPSLTVLYPLSQGDLLGVARYHRRGGDFRAQEIEKGVYTMRYALQPEDGNHIGTSATRDFLLLLNAEEDETLDPLEQDPLFELSAEAAQTSHPCMLSLLRTADDADAEPTIEHDEERDLWSVRLPVMTSGADAPMVMTLVVVGHAEE